MAKILVLHGPNLNMLGVRQPHLYGDETLSTLNDKLYAKGRELGFELWFIQSNGEEKIIEAIHQASQSQIRTPIDNSD
ncbi:MAG: type II 3-dehydroquinate dehydratase [Proteobacteria bacterium]|nr:type II 3-dehydroquinate dehydratase [Pseudomonadota bacterium]